MVGRIEDRESGFSYIELAVVVTITVITLAIAVPSVLNVAQSLRLAGDTRGIFAQLSLARMRAGSAGAKTRVSFNLTANTYQLEVWSTSLGAYQLEGASQSLSEGNTFGFGNITTPAGQQSTIAQTAQIYFNSRGIATDSSGHPTSTSAIYITNPNGQYMAVAVSIAGEPTEYRYSGSAWVLL